MAKDIYRQLWPVHLKPQKDELLSSWLARIAFAHGLGPESFYSISLPKKVNLFLDIDITAKPEFLKILVKKTGTPLNKVVATTLGAYEGWLYNRFTPVRRGTWPNNPPWCMPIRHRNRSSQALFGLQFCPRCLLEDKYPYFRRRWRLAFIVLCEEHKVLLLDRCVECGAPVNYWMGIIEAENVSDTAAMTICRSCASDLRDVATAESLCVVDDGEIEFQKLLMGAVKQGWVEFSRSGRIYSHLFFTVLYKLMTVLTNSWIGTTLREKAVRYYGLPTFNVSIPKRHPYLEVLSVSERRGLAGVARRLLEDWPDGFIAFGKATNLPLLYRVFEDKDYGPMPFWFWSVIHDHLTEFEYRPSYEEAEAELLYKYKNLWQEESEGLFEKLLKYGSGDSLK